MEINHYFYNIMNVNKCPLKYVISLCLTVWAAGALFAQPVVSSSDSAYGRALYKRIMRLNPDSLLRAHADPAVYQRTITAESGSDSIYSREDKRWFYIDRNEFHRVIAAGPSYDTYEYIYATYKGYFYHLSREKLLHEADLAEQAADKYPGDALRNEADYLRVWYNNLGRDSTVWIAEQQAAIKAFQRKGATWWALRVKGHLFQLTAGFGTSYPVAFATAEELIHDIDGLDCRQYPFNGNMYGDIGLLYYKFRDYEAAVPLLKKATRETPGFYFDDSNLKARNSLAIYYRQSGDRKRSDDYFISILQSPDTIYARAVYDAVALANLTGTIQAQWAATLISFGLCLPLLVEVFDHPLGSAWKRFAEKCRIYPPQALPMQVLNSAILSITLVLPVSSLMYRRRLPVGEQFRQYDIPFCVLMALILLLPPLVKKRLYRWQGRVCLILYVMYLAAVLIMPRAGA